jgi:hypothetical protein
VMLNLGTRNILKGRLIPKNQYKNKLSFAPMDYSVEPCP